MSSGVFGSRKQINIVLAKERKSRKKKEKQLAIEQSDGIVNSMYTFFYCASDKYNQNMTNSKKDLVNIIQRASPM